MMNYFVEKKITACASVTYQYETHGIRYINIETGREKLLTFIGVK